MWLLEGEFGIVAHAADDRGWGGLTNGALVEAPAKPASVSSRRVIASSANPPPARYGTFRSSASCW